jgi:hypothetical protein
MGLETPEDVYMLRKSSIFTKGEKSNINLNGYEFISKKVVSSEELTKEPESG